MARKGRPRLVPRPVSYEAWYAPAFRGPLPERRRWFEQKHGFDCYDKDKVDRVILELFRKHNRWSPASETVPIPSVLVLALILRRGFGRRKGDKDTTYRGGNGTPKIPKVVLDWLVSTARNLENDPDFWLSNRSNTEKGIREAAAEKVVRERYPDFTDEQVYYAANIILRKDVWGLYRRKSRAKKKQPTS
jgi:hypothetical protein